jgi:hypothetical protein
MDATRRETLERLLLGAGWAGLRALATGLPAGWFLGRRALAAPDDRAQFLIVSTSAGGDPVNATVPGSYGLEAAGAVYNPQPELAPTKLRLGAVDTVAAAPWAGLPDWALARASFFHHSTYTLSHSDEAKVLRLMGAAKRLSNGVINGEEMVVSICASELASRLGTLQAEPMSVADVHLSYDGRVLSSVPPTALKKILGARKGVLARLRQLRDRSLDDLAAQLKTGGAPPAQRRFLDEYATSQRQLRGIQEDLLTRLDAIAGDGADDQVKAAITLVLMKVTPVVAIGIPFGGDNHTDIGLKGEAAETVSGVRSVGALLSGLKAAGLEDRATFALSNVFGRTFRKSENGRGHNADHAVTVMIGRGLRPGIVGGLRALGPDADFGAAGIEVATGRAVPSGGDVTPDKTLESMGKTLGVALGVAESVMESRITGGRVVKAALT